MAVPLSFTILAEACVLITEEKYINKMMRTIVSNKICTLVSERVTIRGVYI